jgi:uncharacterized damage-inducible protein DinB
MTVDKEFIPTIYQGWHDYQQALTKAIAPLNAEQLSLRASSDLRSVREIAAHVIGVRARWFLGEWFYGEGGEAFKAFGSWDRPEAKVWSAEELVKGLEATWIGMQEAIARWTPEDWEQTWPGEDDTEPEVVTRPWVIWHLIEHDLYHGGQISITLGAHGVPALEL